MKELKIWWIPQVPGERFEVEVHDTKEAMLLLVTLAEYDRFQFEHRIKPEYCNAGGLLVREYGDDEWMEWMDWQNEDGESIDDLIHGLGDGKGA